MKKRENMKTFAIIGTGAVGGYCAVKLMQAGFDVHCLLNNDYAYVKQHGLTLVYQDKTATLPVNAYQNANELPRCDVIIVALKSTANSILKDLLPKIMHEKSLVVIVQNGIGIEDDIAKFIAPEKIIGASWMLKVTKISTGVIKHFGFSSISFAQYYCDKHHAEISDSAKQLADIFKMLGFNSDALPHLPTMRWEKLTGNIPLNGLSIVLDSTTLDLINNTSIYSLLLSLIREVIDAAKKCGADISDDLYQSRLSGFEQLKSMEKHYPSMKDDFDAKKPLELRAIYENAIRIAKENHIAMPLTEMLYQQLVYLNEKTY